ncbi:hypothetical protein O181_061775 [Austropuccinia psidii MF-1]|uniref:Svf1-like N-terminal domain-containing protein n=1 Tax=Austropuccinia psidii MF-1 TaxID=1389203 RepID=A0A9Q3EFT7_9BASI|nr:hypothetical protein [Austropuccinia psidii MF-1]
MDLTIFLDTAWLAQSTGFVTETQTFYITIPRGKLAMFQVINLAIRLWYPQIQFTFRFYDSIFKKHVWKSTNFTNFETPPIFSNSSDLPNKNDDSIHFQFNLTRTDGTHGLKSVHDARGGFTYFGQA